VIADEVADARVNDVVTADEAQVLEKLAGMPTCRSSTSWPCKVAP
jgi:hypothetical protein